MTNYGDHMLPEWVKAEGVASSTVLCASCSVLAKMQVSTTRCCGLICWIAVPQLCLDVVALASGDASEDAPGSNPTTDTMHWLTGVCVPLPCYSFGAW